MFGVECFSESDFDVSLLQEAVECMHQGKALANPTTGEPHNVSYIHLASWWNNQQLLEFLILRCMLDVNYQDSNGRTALMVATQKGHLVIIECLLQYGASVNLQTQSGVTGVGFALHFNNRAAIEKCVEYKATVDMPDRNGNTLLHNSCSSGNYTDVVGIEQLGADIDLKNHAGKTPVMISCEHGHLTIVKYLVSRGCNLKARCNKYFTVEYYAFLSDCPDMIEYIRKKSGTLSDGNGIKLMKACQKHNLFQVTQLLEQNEDPNFKDPSKHWLSPIHIACLSRNLKIIEILIGYGANVNSKDDMGATPLIQRCFDGHTKVVAYLLDVGANPNLKDTKSTTPLMWASKKGFADIVQLLVSKGALLSQKNDTGKSCLVYAAKNGFTDIVRLLLETRVMNVNIKDDYGKTSLFYASQHGHIQTADLLLKWDANVNSSDEDMTTPLMIAAMQNHEQMVRLLLEHKAQTDLLQRCGADVLDLAYRYADGNIVQYIRQAMGLRSLERIAPRRNCFDSSIYQMATAHEAEQNLLDMCENGWAFRDSIKFVIEKGANINCRNNDGNTPILLACASNHLDYIRWLIQYGAEINCQDHKLWSPLMYGVQHNDQNAIRELLDNGADVNMQNSEGKTALMLAIETKRVDIIEILLKEEVNFQCQDKNGDTLIIYCEKYLAEEHSHILRILVDNGVQDTNAVTCGSGSSSHTQCTEDDYELQFIEACVEGSTAKLQVLAAKHQEYSPELIQKCLTILVLNNHTDALLMLQSIGIEISMVFGNGENVLFEAVRMKNRSLVKTLVSLRSLDIAHRNREGLTVTMVALLAGNDLSVSLVSYLLSVERSVHCGVGDCEAILLALNEGIYQLFIDDEECRPYDKICKYCTNANQAEYVLL